MPRTSASAAPARHTAGPAQTRAELTAVRPDLLPGYDTELPGARAAVLARLIGALDREPLPGLTGRDPGVARFAGGTTVHYPLPSAALFAPGDPGLSVDTGAPVDDPGTLARLLWPDSTLAAELDNSVANLALARADRATGPLPADLAGLEQLLTDGHPIHPCCRTRGGMTVADVLAYAPEHRPVLRLRRLRVPPTRWYGTAPPVLYAHPWQAGRLQDRYPWLTGDGETGPVRPLMSLRTVAPLDGGPHVKTAIDVQMTSAVRTVSPAAVHNGPLLSRLFRTVAAGLPIDILAETEAGAVVVDGEPRRHLAFLRREAPRPGPGETVAPMAVLPMLLARVPDPYAFWARLVPLLYPPLLELLRRGLALEAHGQNTLVVLRDGRPVRILYRDLGGVRVSPRRLAAAGFEAPPLEGDLPSDDPAELRTKLTAAAISTVAAQLIAALEQRGADPARLWNRLAEAVRGTGEAAHLLRDPLPVKATTAMRLAPDPLEDRWALLDNPMAA